MCNRKINKNLTLDYNICNRGISKAKEMGINFSAYVSLLIYNDLNKINVIEQQQNEITQEKKDYLFDNELSNEENEELIDKLLGGNDFE